MPLARLEGTGNYGFMIVAVDARFTPSIDVDLSCVEIWDKDGGDGSWGASAVGNSPYYCQPRHQRVPFAPKTWQDWLFTSRCAFHYSSGTPAPCMIAPIAVLLSTDSETGSNGTVMGALCLIPAGRLGCRSCIMSSFPTPSLQAIT